LKAGGQVGVMILLEKDFALERLQRLLDHGRGIDATLIQRNLTLCGCGRTLQLRNPKLGSLALLSLLAVQRIGRKSVVTVATLLLRGGEVFARAGNFLL